jgi:RNA polymerase sigma-70 factor (ECF subfamily)
MYSSGESANVVHFLIRLSCIISLTLFEEINLPVLENQDHANEDLLLIRSVIEGKDEQAFSRLVDRYSDLVYTFSYRYLGNAEDAADCTQEVFIKVFRSIGRFRFQAKFSTWLYAIVRNSCYNMMRARKTRPVRSEEIVGYEPGTSKQESPDDILNRQEINKAFQRGLNRLNHRQKTVIILRDIEGRSYEEISEITGIKLGTVRSTLARARFQMTESLKQFRNEY